MYFVGKALVDRLVNRFALSWSQNRLGQFVLTNLITPITNVDTLLRVRAMANYAAISTATSGNKTILTVPVGKRWTILLVDMIRDAGTINTLDYLAMSDGTYTFKMMTAFTAVSSYVYVPNYPLTFEPGWTLQFHCATNEGASSFQAGVLYEEEDAY